MGVIGRLLALVLGAFVATMVGAAIAARIAKERIVPVDDPDADEVTLAAIFGPIDFRSTATSFRGGTLECWYGGGTIDLRGATLAPDGARLEVRAIFGGAQIVVPEDWHVTSRVIGIGGAGDMRPAIEPTAGTPRLEVEGIAIFGGIGVTATIPEAQPAAMDEAARRAAGERPVQATPEPTPAG
jgi:hypothetical protein